MKTFPITITLTQELKQQELEDILVAAFEGGINYWADKVEIVISPGKSDRPLNSPAEIIAAGGTANVDVEGKMHTLNWRKLLNGIRMHCEDTRIDPISLMENHDADDADAIVQYAIFGELIYC